MINAVKEFDWNQIQTYEVSAFVRDFVAKLDSYITTSSKLDLAKDVAFLAITGHFIAFIEDYLIKFGIFGSLYKLFNTIYGYIFQCLYSLPIVRGTVKKRIDIELAKIEPGIIERNEKFVDNFVLPKKGFSRSEIEKTIKQFEDFKHADIAKLSGTVYHGGSQLRELQAHVYGMFTFANQLHPDCFPEIRKMESEVVSMVLDLYHGPKGSCGTTTSGGTESLLLTCLAAREYARHNRGLTEFEIVAPVTVHAGIDKAAHYFGMKLIHAPLNHRTMKVDTNAVKRLIGPNTVLLVGSAPNFPHGIIDDIEKLSDIAIENNLPLHVDACLGSFVVPFIPDAPIFDFRVPGVTSISCDTHKYGFAPKGSSVIMYRSPELRRYQYFVSTDWTGGLYASPTLAGSRPGALSAGCWATLLYMGRSGYEKSAKEILGSAAKIRDALKCHPDLFFIYGEPIASVVAFGSTAFNIYDLDDAMKKKGWHLNALQNPPAIHMAATYLTKTSVDQLIVDLVESAKELVANGSDASASSGTKALYGVAGSVKTANVAGKLAEGFIDFLYKP